VILNLWKGVWKRILNESYPLVSPFRECIFFSWNWRSLKHALFNNKQLLYFFQCFWSASLYVHNVNPDLDLAWCLHAYLDPDTPSPLGKFLAMRTVRKSFLKRAILQYNTVLLDPLDSIADLDLGTLCKPDAGLCGAAEPQNILKIPPRWDHGLHESGLRQKIESARGSREPHWKIGSTKWGREGGRGTQWSQRLFSSLRAVRLNAFLFIRMHTYIKHTYM
jgi:hypothetical protein